MKKFVFAALLGALTLPLSAETAAHSDPAPVSVHGDMMVGNGGTELWQRLVDGNLRFVSGKVTHPDRKSVV